MATRSQQALHLAHRAPERGDLVGHPRYLRDRGGRELAIGLVPGGGRVGNGQPVAVAHLDHQQDGGRGGHHEKDEHALPREQALPGHR